MCRHVGDAQQGQTPSNEMMQNTTHGLMGGYGGVGMVLDVILAILLAVLLVVAIVKIVQKK